MAKASLLFIHGWPDDSSVWSTQIATLRDHFNCHTFELPLSPKDFPELADLVTEKIKSIEAPVFLVGHDWGAYISYLVQEKHPELVKGLVTLDVGGDAKPQSLPQGIGIMSYQFWLILAWLLRSDKMSRGLAKLFRAPDPEKVSYQLNYLYYFFWRGVLGRKSHWPECPLLYIYGTKKPLMFHSKEWLNFLETSPKHEALAFRHSGHWMMRDQPDELNAAIHKFCNLYRT